MEILGFKILGADVESFRIWRVGEDGGESLWEGGVDSWGVMEMVGSYGGSGGDGIECEAGTQTPEWVV
jgi:hypothetical protein